MTAPIRTHCANLVAFALAHPGYTITIMCVAWTLAAMLTIWWLLARFEHAHRNTVPSNSNHS